MNGAAAPGTAQPPEAVATAPKAPVARVRGRGIVAASQRLGLQLGTLLGYEHLPQMAAALAYRTIFSLVPLTLVALLVVRLFSNPDALVRNFLSSVLRQTGLTQIASDQGFDFTVWITDMVTKFKGIDFTLLGVISLAVLVYAAISLLVEVEGSLNRVYGCSRARTWIQRFLQYWMIVTIGPVLVAASFFVADYFARLATEIAAVNGGASWGPWLTSFAAFVIPAGISAVLLLVLYLIVPNTRVRFLSALVGAIVAAVLFELAKTAFGTYLRQETYKSFYGTLALLPLFLLWVYLLWLIVLFGLRISYLIQHKRMWVLWSAWRGTHLGQAIASGLHPQAAELPAPSGPAWIDPTSLITILAEVARGFRTGRPRSASHIAETLGIDESVVARALEHLEHAGLIHLVGDSRQDLYTLSRPAETIALGDVLLLGYQLLGTVRPGAEPAAVYELRQAQVDAGKGRTLAEVMGGESAGKRG